MPSGSGTYLWAAEYMKWDDVVVSQAALNLRMCVLCNLWVDAGAVVAVPVSVFIQGPFENEVSSGCQGREEAGAMLARDVGGQALTGACHWTSTIPNPRA